jgi:hypothetical protein
MDITSTFLPIAQELIDNIFPTDAIYHRSEGKVYDPATGEVVETIKDYPIKMGLLYQTFTEEGGVGEENKITIWIHHGPNGMPHQPTTADHLTYQGTKWKVTNTTNGPGINPTYMSKGLIASRLVLERAD